MIPMTEGSVAAFAQLLQDLGPVTCAVRGHDSLDAACYHTGHAPARCPWNDEEKKEFEERGADEVLRQSLASMMEGEEDSFDYTKHVRSYYCKISLEVPAGTPCDSDRIQSIDVVFIPAADMAKYGSPCSWMKYNFDLQICANAITTNGLYCLAPHEISAHLAFMRLDQYCLDIVRDTRYYADAYECILTMDGDTEAGEEDEEAREMRHFLVVHPESYIERKDSHRWKHASRCECFSIIYNRIQKYMTRGFHFIYGTYEDYERFQKLNYKRVTRENFLRKIV